MRAGGLYAPLDVQHRLDIGADTIRIRPASLRIALIRLVLLGFGGGVVFLTIWRIAQLGLHWLVIPLVVGLLMGLVALAGAFLPWKTLHADIDRTGLVLSGHGAARTGRIAWDEVDRIIVQHATGAGGSDGGTSNQWTVALSLKDGAAVGILRIQSEHRADELVAALRSVGRIDSPPLAGRPAVDVRPVTGDWPPAPPHGFPHHPRVHVKEFAEGTAVGPREPAQRAMRNYAALGLAFGIAAVVLAAWVVHVFGLAWPGYSCHFPCTGFGKAILHTFSFALVPGLLWVASKLVVAAWHLRGGPLLHLVTDQELLVLDRDEQVRQRFALADIRTVEAGGGTLCLDMGEDHERLHFEGTGAPDDLYWALRALEYVLGAGGWIPTRPRQDRATFDREHGWRFSARLSMSAGGDADARDVDV